MKKRKVLEAAVSLLVAICLWMYVVTVVTPDDDIIIEDIPITFVGESNLRTENNLILTNRSARTVTVKFHGSRVLLKELKEERDSIRAVLDVSSFTSERDYSFGYEVVLPASLQGDVQTVECSPKTVQFTVEQLASRQLPVKGVFDGTLAPNYEAGELTYEQTMVRVSGPVDVVERANYAQVILGGSQISRTTTRDVPVKIIDMDGQELVSEDLTQSVTQLQVTMPVYLRKELNITVDPLYGGAATAQNTRIEITPSTVSVLGEPDILRDMKEISLGSLDLSSILDETPILMTIPVPKGILLPAATTTASVTVTFDGLEILGVPVYNLDVLNLREDMEYRYPDDMLFVTLRGPSEALVELDVSQITVQVDLENYNDAGSFTIPATVITGDDSVAAVGQYTVTLELEQV